MSLASRLRALAKALERGEELPPEVLERLAACLDEVDEVLPPVRRGRPKKRELAPHMLLFYVDSRKALDDSADKVALQRLIRQRLVVGVGLKRLQHMLARARKALK